MNERVSDQEAVGRVRQGDQSSYEILVNRYNRRLHGIAQKYLRNEADAEDVVQGAHLLALRHIDQYSGQADFLSWISSITAHEALTHLRRSKASVTESDDAALDYVRAYGPSPEQQAIRRDMRGILDSALDGLPAPYRSVFELRQMEELSTAETGARLGLTSACVKTRLLRARSLLRGRLSTKLKDADLAGYRDMAPAGRQGVESRAN